jgi:malate dehydrogenase
MEKKIAVIGAGNVGASAALYLAEANVADIVLLDVVEGMPQGKALDLTEAGPVRGYNSRLSGSNDYKDMKGCDLVVVTAGVARTPGMSREDLLSKNSGILDKVVEGIMNNCPEALILVVSNPLDIMTYHTLKKSGLAKNRVFGQAGVLDATRFRSFVAMELGVALTDTQAMVMGGHGDTMVPLPRYTTVSGIPIAELMPAQRVKALIERTRKGGGEIVQLLKSGSAYYAPAAAVVDMVKAVIRDEKKLLPASVLLEGQYGLKDICIGVPVILGAGGVEKVIELELNEEELAALHNSAETYREILKSMGYSG